MAGVPENSPLSNRLKCLTGPFSLLMGRFPTLMGRFPDFVLRGRFTSWKSTGKQPIKKRGVKRFLIKWGLSQRTPKRGGQKRGVCKPHKETPTENSFRAPSPRYVLPPPYPISLSKSLRSAPNFPQLTTSETAFGGSRKMVSDGPSSRGFAFRNVLPLAPPSLGYLWLVLNCPQQLPTLVIILRRKSLYKRAHKATLVTRIAATSKSQIASDCNRNSKKSLRLRKHPLTPTLSTREPPVLCGFYSVSEAPHGSGNPPEYVATTRVWFWIAAIFLAQCDFCDCDAVILLRFLREKLVTSKLWLPIASDLWLRLHGSLRRPQMCTIADDCAHVP